MAPDAPRPGHPQALTGPPGGGLCLRLPSRDPRDRRLLMLYTLAAAYPRTVSVGELAFIMRGILPRGAVRRALHYFYYYYQAVERVSRGAYRAAPGWREALERCMPTWRVDFLRLCVEYNVCHKIIYVLGEIDVFTKLPTNTKGYHALPRKRVIQIIKSSLGRDIDTLMRVLHSYVKKRAVGLIEELGEKYKMALELLAILFSEESRGRHYLEAGEPRRLAYRLQDTARWLLGESSSIAGTLDPDALLGLIGVLRDYGLVYAQRFGGVYKVRLDRAVSEDIVRHAIEESVVVRLGG